MTHRPPLVTVSGPPAVGTTTVASALAEDPGFEVVSGGDAFRAIAADRGVDVGTLAERAASEPAIDRAVDGHLRSVLDDHCSGAREPAGPGLLVVSRLAGWHADGRADLAVLLDARFDARADRIEDREETPDDLAAREERDAARYRELYGVEIGDREPYDLVVDTEVLSPAGAVETVRTAVLDACSLGGPDATADQSP